MDWEEMFEPKFLSRGKAYFKDGCVTDLQYDDGILSAVVEGTEDYDVSITLENDIPSDMECSCPYAEDGNLCKHMAAVLYAYDAGNVKSQPKDRKQKPSVQELIANAAPEILRSFLCNAVMHDKALCSDLELYINRAAGEIDLTAYQKNIKTTIHQYEDRHHFIDYYHASGFIDEMMEYLDDDISDLLECGHIPEVFSLCNFLFKAVSDVDMDDSDGELTMFGERTAELWKEMIARADSVQKKEMFHWFYSHLRDYVIDYMEDYITEVFFECFEEQEYLKQKIGIVDKQIAETTQTAYAFHHLILRRIRLMEQLKVPSKEILTYCKEYESLSDVRKYLVKWYLSHRQKEKAIELLERSIMMDQNYAGLVKEYRIQLKDLYRKNGAKEKYCEHLRKLVTDFGDIAFFRELKAYYSETEWETVRETIFTETKSWYLNDFYAEDQLYDRLMQSVSAQGSIYTVQRYEKVLAKQYPAEILQIYVNELEKAAAHPCTRKSYQEWAKTLTHMKKITGGADCVKGIVNDWREKYKNRPALMDELTKAGL